MSADPQTPPPRVLPRGRHAASRAIVWESQRERMLAAMAEAVAEKGYGRVAVADVVERAGVSRKTFYEHFANKEACFLAAYDAGVDELLGAIEEGIGAGEDWQAAVMSGTLAYLETLAANPAFARTFLVEVLAAGPAAFARRTAVHERFAAQLAAVHGAVRERAPELPEVPPHVYRACVGAVNELVVERLVERGAESLPELAGALFDVQVSLFVGRERAGG
jgi:AcrR family transcriptional regulator